MQLRSLAHRIGSPRTLVLAVLLPALSGIPFGWSDEWWTWLDRAVYMATLWIALIVQAAQNRDTVAMQKKLDELIKAIDQADDSVQGLEDR